LVIEQPKIPEYWRPAMDAMNEVEKAERKNYHDLAK